MNAHTSKSGYGLTVHLAPRGVRKCAAALRGAPWGAPPGAVMLVVDGAARPRGFMGWLDSPLVRGHLSRDMQPPEN